MPKGRKGVPECSVESCQRSNDARGYCRLHYARLMKSGDPLVGGKRTRAEQFASSYDVDANGCWIWNRSLVTNGYAAFWDGGIVTGHRWSYENFIGPIPAGLQLDHLCRVRSCVNPDHLEPVTLAENVLRGVGVSAVNARKTHCQNNHPFDTANTYIGSNGSRVCRPCKAAWHQERVRKSRAESVA